MTEKNPLAEAAAADPDAVTTDKAIEKVLEKSPSAVSDADLDDLVLAMREKRSAFIVAEQAKEARKEGVDLDAEWS